MSNNRFSDAHGSFWFVKRQSANDSFRNGFVARFSQTAAVLVRESDN
ncbi:hypothetical protein HYR99_09505 [Candidatus Poribacteria bacterium]|nr:hypothetical protein [Candidatus Poribacteria bacterium]